MGADLDAPNEQGTAGNGQAKQAFIAEIRDKAWGCFSSGHKFCRNVCPVMQVTRNENHSPTAFHANVVAMERGHLDVADVAEDYVHCTQCGACELRCPNTLMAGEFYRARTRTVDVVKAVRALAVDSGVEQPSWKRWVEATVDAKNEPVLDVPVSQENVRTWAKDLDIATGGETILFVDCEAAFYRTSLPRAVAQILQTAGVEFGLMNEQWCCGGPALEMGYRDHARAFAEHNLADWRAVGAKRILVLDPHDYISFTEDYPRYFGEDYDDIEIVLVIDLLAELIKDGRLSLTEPIERVATYHDPCRLNKRKGIHAAPREILRAVPGLDFRDVDHVTQWSYCSGGGGGLPIEKPEITAAISGQRLEKAAALEVDLLISACVWSERHLTTAGLEQSPQIEVRDLFEVVAESAGLEVDSVRTDAVGGLQ
jgi:heterodisulfide reductase subunit D